MSKLCHRYQLPLGSSCAKPLIAVHTHKRSWSIGLSIELSVIIDSFALVYIRVMATRGQEWGHYGNTPQLLTIATELAPGLNG